MFNECVCVFMNCMCCSELLLVKILVVFVCLTLQRSKVSSVPMSEVTRTDNVKIRRELSVCEMGRQIENLSLV